MPNGISLDGKVAIVTGGARGLGKVMAQAMLDAGAAIFIVARSADQVAVAVDELRENGGKCDGMTADVTDVEACKAIVAATESAFGFPHILVNNAAVGLAGLVPKNIDPTAPMPFHLIDPQMIETITHINFLGPWNMYHAVGAGMLERGYGRIVNISTSLPTMRKAGVYGPLKAALEVSTTVWAQQLEGTGVTANVLLPGGGSDTAMVPGGEVGTRAIAFTAGKGPKGLEGTDAGLLPPEIMGPPMVWLASEASADYNGRRFAARDWDADLPADEAAERAVQQRSDKPVIM